MPSKKFFGYGLISLPFISVFGITVYAAGPLVALLTFGLAALFIGAVVTGVVLIEPK